MRITPLVLLFLSMLAAAPARADLRITSDHGGYVTEYKAKFERIRDRHERVIFLAHAAVQQVRGGKTDGSRGVSANRLGQDMRSCDARKLPPHGSRLF